MWEKSSTTSTRKMIIKPIPCFIVCNSNNHKKWRQNSCLYSLGDGPNVLCCLSTQNSVEYFGIYINRVTRNLTYVSVEKMPIFCEVTYHIEIFQFFRFCHKTGRYIQNIDKIFQGSIYDHIKILYTEFQVSVSFGSVYRLFQN